MPPIFIAEIKTRSPFGFLAEKSFNELMELALDNGDWVSVHDNVLWGGDYESIAYVRKFTNQPILAKGLHATDSDIVRAIDHGASFALVVDRVPNEELWPYCLFEWSSFKEFQKHPELHSYKHVCNSRCLRTGQTKFNAVRDLGDFIDAGVWVCQASGISRKSQINEKVSAFIVGENLPIYVGPKHINV